jgi:hypothetical protein
VLVEEVLAFIDGESRRGLIRTAKVMEDDDEGV